MSQINRMTYHRSHLLFGCLIATLFGCSDYDTTTRREGPMCRIGDRPLDAVAGAPATGGATSTAGDASTGGTADAAEITEPDPSVKTLSVDPDPCDPTENERP